MPSSEKSTKALPGNAPRSPKARPKTTQRPGAKAEAQTEKDPETDEREAAEERKPSSKLPAAKGSKVAPAAPRPEARARKLTPQQQIHMARARRRKRNERLILAITALVVIAVIAVVTWRVVVNNQESAQLASAHAAATATAAVHATATQTELNVLEPETPPAVTGKTITTKDGLQYIDIKVGTGTAVKEGDTINVRYVGWNVPANCQVVDVCQFDSSYYENIQQNKDPMATIQFQLVGPDQGGVIQGWVDGIIGMKPGGKRRLTIPPALAYKDQAQSGGGEQPIPANATLIFDVELVSIGNTPTSTPTPTPGG
ncbi:MAG TPA: FKBP-type peptidyl-prolyl cis-trans isomerase [Ktedonobacterales bacterium]|nr:FKBP-type peptidyl-prolyl cis-trans isomerase [Ktedonobacterales bacterium]